MWRKRRQCFFMAKEAWLPGGSQTPAGPSCCCCTFFQEASPMRLLPCSCSLLWQEDSSDCVGRLAVGTAFPLCPFLHGACFWLLLWCRGPGACVPRLTPWPKGREWGVCLGTGSGSAGQHWPLCVPGWLLCGGATGSGCFFANFAGQEEVVPLSGGSCGAMVLGQGSGKGEARNGGPMEKGTLLGLVVRYQLTL